jgi:long-chain-fatty-acid--CoA ligase ACSBG
MVVVLEGNEQLRKYSEIALDLHSVKTIVVWGEPIESEISQLFPEQISVYSWDEFIRLGETIDRSQVETRWSNVRPGNCATVIYTSGTTGPPKAVMISHDNLTWTSKQICRGGYMDLNEEDKIVSYLPLSHIAAQLIDIHCIMHIGGAVYFAQRDALQGSLLNTMKEVRPTFFFGVPRVYEKMQTKLNQQFRKTNILAKLLHNASTSVGKARSANIQVDGNESYPWGYFLAKKLYLDYVKSALGLENCKGCYCAAAPISEETLWFFAGLDIPIYEVFGLSECTGPHTISGQGQWKIGYCGRPIPGTDTKIDPESGEMRIRGRHVFMGYMHMPQETREIFDESGYIRSGDIAEVHASGLYKIIGRTKDLIVTAGGENVSPTLLENTIKKELEAVSNCIVIGDHRKYLTMLISLQVQIDKSTGNFTDELSHSAQAIGNSFGSNATTYTSAKEDPKWTQYIEQGIAKANKKAPSNAQKIRKWRWLPQELSEQTGETTATQKVKRNVVISNHQDLVDQMYADSDK